MLLRTPTIYTRRITLDAYPDIFWGEGSGWIRLVVYWYIYRILCILYS